MRPHSITMFEKLFLASLVLGAINFFVSMPAMREQLAADPNAAAMVGDNFLIGVFIFSMLISLLLWYFISRRASNIAKWILVVFFVVGLVMLPGSLGALPALPLIVSLLSTVLQGAAIYFLFRPDAKAWFARPAAVDSVHTDHTRID